MVSFLMVFILSLAFINLMFISSILDGVLETINEQIITNVVSNITIEPQEKPVRKNYITNAEEIQNRIESIPGISAVAGRYKIASVIAYDKNKNGKFKYVSGQIIGIDPEKEKKISNISTKIISGRYLERVGSGNILLGAELAGGYANTEDLYSLDGVKVGDTVKVIFNDSSSRNYKVRGIFLTKFNQVDRLAFITAKEAESILSVHNNVSQILVKTDDRGNEDRFVNKIRTIAPNLEIKKWSDYMGPMANISKSFDVINLIITVIGIIVAAITIFILIYVNVVNKRRQIGILKAIGIKQHIIVCSYVYQALFYAILGITVGLLLIFYAIDPYFKAHPLDIAVGDVSLSLNMPRIIYGAAGLLIAALVAGFLPSWRAARENILKAIWGA